ncbi:hypothetical protein JW905_01730 [bacterium]|nr:hypothetical protein [candidate division CSSED10-310 bacterium]
MRIVGALLVRISLMVSITGAGTITVGPGGEDYATIQEALPAAHGGDLVLVSPGTCNGPITMARDVHLMSAGCTSEVFLYNPWYNASLETVLDGGAVAPVCAWPKEAPSRASPSRPAAMGTPSMGCMSPPP